MHHSALAVVAALAVPVFLFLWMMGMAALALLTNGEDPRAVLAMPRTFFRNPTLDARERAAVARPIPDGFMRRRWGKAEPDGR